MKQVNIYFLFACLLQQTFAVELYVSSEYGDDSNDGILKPVSTLFQCQNIIHNIRKSGLNEFVTVHVDEGEYESIELLNELDSNIQFIGSNATIISGGYKITTNWTQNNNNIWSTSIKLLSNYSINNNTMNFPKQFWINNERKNKISTNILYWKNILNPNNPNDDINRWGLVYNKNDINTSWNLLAPGVIIFVFHQWTVSLHQVSKHYTSNQTIIFQQPSQFVLGKFLKASQKRWYIEGIPEMNLLTQSGEWNAMIDNINKPTQIIINYSPFKNEIFPSNDVYIEHPFVYKPLISLIGTGPNRPIENVTFNGFEFKYSSYKCPLAPQECDGDNAAFLIHSDIPGAINMKYTKNITFKNAIFHHIGSFGIYMVQSPETNIVYNNFSDIGSGGIFSSTSNYSLISDNYIINGGFIFRHGPGVGAFNAANMTIQHNEMTQLLANGINSGGGPGSPYLVINKNHIHNNGRSDKYGISDYGSMHIGFMNASCCTAQITNNLLHDIISVVWGGEGIYLDYGTSDVFVYGNLVYNVAGYALNWNYEAGDPPPPHKYPVPPIIVKNNIFIISGAGESPCCGHIILPNTSYTFERGIHWNSGPIYIGNGIFMNNINYVIKPNGNYLFSGKSIDSWFNHSNFDYNIYYSAIDRNVSFPATTKNGPMITLKQWQLNTKLDINSLITDPLFVNVNECNFTLQPNSSAYKDINFQSLNLSDVGPRYSLN